MPVDPLRTDAPADMLPTAKHRRPSLVIVRYSKWSLLPFVFPGALLWMLGITLIATGAGVLVYVAAIFILPFLMIAFARTLDRRPLMTITPDGITLHVAGEIFLKHDEMDFWVEERRAHHQRWATFSIQGKPRSHLDIGFWARVNQIKANTLLDGDLCFDETRLDCSANDIATACSRFGHSGSPA